MDDLISRQAAIDALHTYFEDGFEQDRWWNSMHVLKAIRGVPSAQQWIPVTERLPEENGDYLVTGRQGAVNKRRYDDGHWYGNWAVVAWMPLPAPMKGGEP
ncbi:MAG: DUF551 domain-containing protein [Spirochaetales bacterium]|nr:DUF551 domain-containing protein [Spirochaetales bacterium]